MRKKFEEVICIKGGREQDHLFRLGEIYPICGDENGMQLVFKNAKGNAEIVYLTSYGSEFEHYHCPINNDNIMFIDFKMED